MRMRALPPSRAVALGLAAGLVLASCGSDPSPVPVATPGPTSLPASTISASTPASPSAAIAPASTATASATPSASTSTTEAIGIETVVDGLDQPVFVTTAGDGTDRLVVAEQPGIVRVVEGGTLRDTPFLDIRDRVTAGGERGLLGLAFPPGFGPSLPEVFVHYSGEGGATVVSAFRLDAHDVDRLDPATEQVVFTTPQPYPNHNGGWIGFDPDGMLLLGLGDGGSGGDPENRASNLGEPLGKILRLDVLHAPDDQGYAIPADNPFVDRSGARPEVLHSGLRNPFRASIDAATGDLWIGDVGQNAWEEIDVARAGAAGLDFGWRRWEGRHCYDPSPATNCDPSGVTMPIAEYGHGAGCSVIGGVVYRGQAIPSLRGRYLFSDYCSGTLWSIDAASDASQTPATVLETGAAISSIGLDAAGEVVLTDLSGGRLLRLVGE